METKIFAYIFLIAALCSLTFASAASFSLDKNSIILSQPINSSTFTITSANSLNVTITTPIINSISFSVPEAQTNIVGSRTFTLVPSTSTLDSTFKLGTTYSGNVNIANSSQSTDNQSISLTILKSYCSSGEQSGNLTIDSVSIKNSGSGDDTNWQPLDQIEVKVKVTNNNPDNRISTIVKLGLYNSKGSEKLGLNSIGVGNIGSSDKTATFTFTVPADLDADNYFLYVKAYRDGNENTLCTSISGDLAGVGNYYQPISVNKEDSDTRQVIFDNILVDPSTATCGDDITVSTKIVNVGTSDQEKVKTSIYNKELGIDSYIVTNNLNEGDSVPIEFTFKVPQNATQKSYVLDFSNSYDYNGDYPSSDDAAYDQLGDTFTTNLVVSGCQVSSQNVQVTATLQSEAIAGQNAIIDVNVKNLGTADTSYNLVTSGTENFASSVSVATPSFTLGAGQSRDVLITLQLKPGASGDNTFDIKTLYGGNVKDSSVVIPITSSQSSGLGASIKQNWVIWLIVLINVVLIIAIIIIAVRVLGK